MEGIYSMKKLIFLVLVAFALVSCRTVDYTYNATGVSDNVTLVVKDFIPLGIVTVRAQEVHYGGPFGFKHSIHGSKITYSDLMQEAAKLEADDVINVRIDTNADFGKRKGAFDWLTGWTRTYNYIGTALAIKYTGKLDTDVSDPQFSTVPKAPDVTKGKKQQW